MPGPRWRLAVNQAEAKVVREIFSTFLRNRSIAKTLEVIRSKGWVLKSWTTRKGESKTAWQLDYFDQQRKRHKEQYRTRREADARLR